MAIVSGVNIPDNKRVEIALRSIFGIGPTQAKDVVETAGIIDNPRVRDLSESDLTRIREIIDRQKVVEGDLRREVNGNIRRLIDIGAYRGFDTAEDCLSEVRELRPIPGPSGAGEWRWLAEAGR